MKIDPNKRLFVADICNTLFNINTTFGFIDFYLKQRKSYVRSVAFRFLVAKWSPLFYILIIANKLSGKDWHKKMALRLLKGEAKSDLYQEAEKFYTNKLCHLQIEPCYRLLEQAQQNGEKIVLLSSSIDPVVYGISKAIGAEYSSTEIAYDKERCAGFVLRELSGNKDKILSDFSGFSSITVMTDNFSDKRLLEKAHIRYVVLNHPGDRKKWRGLEANFIEL
ncbi:hypothetical protein C900_02865 [Fulvivirga imtechensis AK7]|uniref:Phosphoserine phosphatase n=1 Tax=Fulvivirga imtechensis AK7 TaxID=1237149 RepID=L8JQY0_9BACT|nr:HAD family hydrolase [Fulvivirga imtechensis]ELR71250.1 hypothetical protein C900_02865 [Fulvivirga imtechensis AK7]